MPTKSGKAQFNNLQKECYTNDYHDAKALTIYYENPILHSTNIYLVMIEDQFITNTEIVIDDDLFNNIERTIKLGSNFWGNEKFDIIKMSEFASKQNNQAWYWLSYDKGEKYYSRYYVNGVTYFINDCIGINQSAREICI